MANRVPVQLPHKLRPPFPGSTRGTWRNTSRDGFAVQGWGRVPLLDNRLSIGVGAGIYQSFDTRLLPAGNHENVHGWAPVYISATYYTEKPWFAQVAVNHIHPESDTNSNTYLVEESDTACGKRSIPRPLPGRGIVRRKRPATR